MALSYPRPLPSVGAGRQRFEVMRVDRLSPSADGRVGAVSLGEPRWAASYSAPNSRAGGDEWRAFIDSLQGAQRLFYGRDLARPYPLAYQDGEGVAWPSGFTGDAASWSTTAERDTLTLALPTGFVISTGDYVGWRWLTAGEHRRALVRSLETVTASSGAASFAVNIPLHTVIPPGATATLDKPDCLMRQVVDQTELGEVDRRLIVPGRLGAIQVLLP